MTTYLLDANVFIQAKNLHYGLDFCPAFWNWIEEAHAAWSISSMEADNWAWTVHSVWPGGQPSA